MCVRLGKVSIRNSKMSFPDVPAVSPIYHQDINANGDKHVGVFPCKRLVSELDPTKSTGCMPIGETSDGFVLARFGGVGLVV